jgi:hypothetical protein
VQVEDLCMIINDLLPKLGNFELLFLSLPAS